MKCITNIQTMYTYIPCTMYTQLYIQNKNRHCALCKMIFNTRFRRNQLIHCIISINHYVTGEYECSNQRLTLATHKVALIQSAKMSFLRISNGDIYCCAYINLLTHPVMVSAAHGCCYIKRISITCHKIDVITEVATEEPNGRGLFVANSGHSTSH